jgi:hypothetical protein
MNVLVLRTQHVYSQCTQVHTVYSNYVLQIQIKEPDDPKRYVISKKVHCSQKITMSTVIALHDITLSQNDGALTACSCAQFA